MNWSIDFDWRFYYLNISLRYLEQGTLSISEWLFIFIYLNVKINYAKVLASTRTCVIERDFFLFVQVSSYNLFEVMNEYLLKFEHLLSKLRIWIVQLHRASYIYIPRKRILPRSFQLGNTKNTRGIREALSCNRSNQSIQWSLRANKSRGETEAVGRVTSAYNSSAVVFTAKPKTKDDRASRSRGVSGPFAARWLVGHRLLDPVDP